MSENRMLRPCPLLLVAGKAMESPKDSTAPNRVDPKPSGAGKNSTFAGETNLETWPDGSSYRSRYSYRVF